MDEHSIKVGTQSANEIFTKVLGQDVTQAFDDVEALLHNPRAMQRPELHAALTRAKDALFSARTIIDAEINKEDDNG